MSRSNNKYEGELAEISFPKGMKEDNFLEASLESYQNFCFKSPSKDKNSLNIESLPISCKQTPIMSPLPLKFSLDNCGIRTKSSIKKERCQDKLLLMKEIDMIMKNRINSADKAKPTVSKLCKNDPNKIAIDSKNPIDFLIPKVSFSAEKNKKVQRLSAAKMNHPAKVDNRSPLIPDKKIECGLSSPDSSHYESKIIRETVHHNRPASFNKGTFSPKKVLDFDDKSQRFKGRNLFDESYEHRKWKEYEHPLLSPDFKHAHESSEIYTPSFDHKNEIDFRKQSPMSLLKQIKDVSAQKTAEPPYLRKRRNKFKQKQEDYSFIGHIMVDNKGQQFLRPLYPVGHRNISLPPLLPIGKQHLESLDNDEENKENVAPNQHYPTCNCQQYYANMCYNPHGYYYAPASLYFVQRSIDSDSGSKRRAKIRRKSRENDNCIAPTKTENRMLLHAYPINEAYTAQLYANQDKDYIYEQNDPVYVKKLEYSADKLASSSKHKMSSSKKNEKKPDRSVEIDHRSKDYFEIKRSDRKNTLSGLRHC